MGTVFRKAWTAPLPPNAEIVVLRGKRMARYRIRSGKVRTAEVFTAADGRERIRGETRSYIAKFRDAAGYWVERPTGCTDETAARAVLAQLVRRAELIRAGVITPEEDAASRHGAESIETNLDAWRDHLRLKGSTEHWYVQARRRVARVATDRGVKRLRDFTAATVERWLREQADTGMSAGTRNGYRQACVTFINWCVRAGRLTHNPLLAVAVADQRADTRRQRRALTEEELARLLDAAQRRPLARSRVPHIVLNARDEKNRRGSEIPLRADLAADIRAWLADRLAWEQQAGRCGMMAFIAIRMLVADHSTISASDAVAGTKPGHQSDAGTAPRAKTSGAGDRTSLSAPCTHSAASERERPATTNQS